MSRENLFGKKEKKILVFYQKEKNGLVFFWKNGKQNEFRKFLKETGKKILF